MADPPPISDPPPGASGNELHPAPTDPAASENSKSELPPSEYKDPWIGQPAQFTLTEFLIWIAIVSIGLSGLAWIGPQIFAGICGFLALAALVITLVWNPQASLFQLVWYALLVMYMIAIVIAVLAPVRIPH